MSEALEKAKFIYAKMVDRQDGIENLKEDPIRWINTIWKSIVQWEEIDEAINKYHTTADLDESANRMRKTRAGEGSE